MGCANTGADGSGSGDNPGDNPGGNPGATGRGRTLNRRGLLRAGLLLAIAPPLLAACTSPPPPPEADQLQPLLAAATADAATAKSAAAAFADNATTLGVIATVRQQQAAALRTEVDRAAATTAPPTATGSSSGPPAPPTNEAAVTTQLLDGLAKGQQAATNMAPTVARYRAGLVGSVAAGCASLTEALNNTPVTGITTAAAALTTTAGGADRSLPSDTTAALQSALGAEHAALWMYGTASAFVTASAGAEVLAAMTAVQSLRDTSEHRLAAAGVAPQPAQPAYLVPQPATSQATALAALAVAESDATIAWRGVLERTDDQGVRKLAVAALVDSAVRQCRWRRLGNQIPASAALPGQAG